MPFNIALETFNITMMNKKKGDDEKMSKSVQMVLSREDHQNFKERSYEMPSYKVKYLKNKEKRERSKYW